MTPYRTAAGYGEAEYEDKRSRFIGRVKPVASEAEARAFIDEMRRKYADATHNVFAYVLREGNILRWSDDGEPGGTSGQPTLAVLQGAGLTDVCCVTTRYFGGTLLGAGGLVRAYSKSVAGALKAAEEQGAVLEMIPSAAYDAVLPYAAYGKLENLLAQRGYQKQDVRFEQDVAVRILVDAELEKTFLKDMTEAFCGSVEPKRVLECYAKRYCKK